jgi:hypothetical protein
LPVIGVLLCCADPPQQLANANSVPFLAPNVRDLLHRAREQPEPFCPTARNHLHLRNRIRSNEKLRQGGPSRAFRHVAPVSGEPIETANADENLDAWS